MGIRKENTLISVLLARVCVCVPVHKLGQKTAGKDES